MSQFDRVESEPELLPSVPVEATPRPWAIHSRSDMTTVVPAEDAKKHLGFSIDEQDDRLRFARSIASLHGNDLCDFAHRIKGKEARANAELIVTAVNSFDAQQRRIQELEKALRETAILYHKGVATSPKDFDDCQSERCATNRRVLKGESQ